MVMIRVTRTQTHLQQPWRLDRCNHSLILSLHSLQVVPHDSAAARTAEVSRGLPTDQEARVGCAGETRLGI